PLLLLDEPTSDLDPAGTAEVFEVLKKLNAEKGITTVLIEHKLDAVFEMADRMLVMENGRLILDGKPFELCCREAAKLRELGVRLPQLIELALLTGLNSEAPDYETVLKRLVGFLAPPGGCKEGNSEFFGFLGNEFAGEKLTETDKFAGEKLTETDKFAGDKLTETDKFAGENPAGMKKVALPPHIRLEKLFCKREDGSLTLKNLDLEIGQGEFLALLGHNGAGKSTLAGHLIGFHRPSEGRVLLKGRDIRKFSTAELAREVGYLFQNPDSQLFTDSVEGEIRFGLEILKLKEPEIKKRTASALEMMELLPFRKRHPHALSRGQRQRLAVASVLALEPDLLVLDEPTTGQDREHIRKFLEKIRALNRQGKTVVLITHDMELAAEYAERVVVLKKGEVLLDGPAAEVFSRREELEATGLCSPFPVRLCLDLQRRGVEIPLFLTLDKLKTYLLARCPEIPEGSEPGPAHFHGRIVPEGTAYQPPDTGYCKLQPDVPGSVGDFPFHGSIEQVKDESRGRTP
ncbi:MAG: ATP-binding cassette domain-containing protein, partial [Methanosarcinaceae archaeon]|nr:ATP-binding cassette domain-containing protein [Methanosarcinaceae archaeon]